MYNSYMGKTKTPYGLDRYRRPYFKGEFRYPFGIKPQAVILDIDGCWMDRGNSVNPKTMAWVKKHHAAKRTIIVVTARVHEWEYAQSWDMLAHTMPCAFIGPICRSDTNPLYAPEFKREVAEGMSVMYDIVGAADDSKFVNTMWRWWAKEYFEDPADFDLLETSYTHYTQWRTDLPAKSAPVRPYTPAEPFWGSTMVGGAKHRAAGFRDFGSYDYGTEYDEHKGWYDLAAQQGPETVPLDVEEIFAEEVAG